MISQNLMTAGKRTTFDQVAVQRKVIEGHTQEGAILVVDDRQTRAERLIGALDAPQFEFDYLSEVPNIESVLGSESPYDCVLCNAGLSNVSWASVRRAMRNFDVQVPVIVVAEDRDVESMTTALGLGAADFFVRPEERPGLLRHAIGRCVTHHRLQRELKESKENLERTNQELRHSLRMLQQDQQAGRQVQMALLPSGSLQVNGYWFSQKIFTSLYLSGDFADYFQVSDDQVIFFLTDVSGHGSSSAFATVLLKNLFARKRSDYLRRQDETVTSPVKMLALANSELLELELNKYATMVVGNLNFNTGELTYSVAGHLPQPILLTREGIRYLEGEGPPVGLVPEAIYSATTIQTPDEFIMAVLSDGILELLDDKDLLEKESALLQRLAGPIAKPRELWQRLGLDHVDRDHLPDDVAVLFISKGLS